MKKLKLRVRYYPGEYPSFQIEKHRGWLKGWEFLYIVRIANYEDEENPELFAKEVAIRYMNNYVKNNKQYISDPYTVSTKEYWLNKDTGEWIEIFENTELDISL